MATTLNASTSNGLIQTADTSGVLALQAADTTIASVSSTGVAVTGAITATGQIAALKSETAKATTSGTSVDFTSIPSWVKRITLIISGVSFAVSATPIIQLGVSGTPETTSYVGTAGTVANSNQTSVSTTSTAGFNTGGGNYVVYGTISIVNISGNIWVCNGFTTNGGSAFSYVSGQKTLAGTLNMIRYTSIAGTAAFNAGSINILYE